MSLAGTHRAKRTGLLVSVVRGRPEVAGRKSKRRDRPETDIRREIPVKRIGPLASLIGAEGPAIALRRSGFDFSTVSACLIGQRGNGSHGIARFTYCVIRHNQNAR